LKLNVTCWLLFGGDESATEINTGCVGSLHCVVYGGKLVINLSTWSCLEVRMQDEVTVWSGDKNCCGRRNNEFIWYVFGRDSSNEAFEVTECLLSFGAECTCCVLRSKSRNIQINRNKIVFHILLTVCHLVSQ
jgi:hypothetical protein